MKIYSGVLLAESLTDMNILSDLEVVEVLTKAELNPTNEQPKLWTWYRIQVTDDKLLSVAKQLSLTLKPRAWYTNLWSDGDYMLIFPNRIFRSSSVDDAIWSEAVKHGMSIGIPLEQLTPIDEILHTK